MNDGLQVVSRGKTSLQLQDGQGIAQRICRCLFLREPQAGRQLLETQANALWRPEHCLNTIRIKAEQGVNRGFDKR